MNVLDISSTQIHTCFLLDDLRFFQGYFALTFFDINISQSHVFVQIFDFILNIKNILLVLFLFPQTPQNKISKLFTQVLTLLSLSLNRSFCFPNHFLQSNALLIPTTFDRTRSGKSYFIPNRFFTQFEFSNIFFELCKFFPIESFVINSVFVISIQSILLLHHDRYQIIQLSLLPLHYLLYCQLHLLICMMFFSS